jgi:PAS domain S-box-containing protein
MSDKHTKQELQAENEELRQRLTEAEDTLRAIRSGEVDALVTDTSLGQRVFTLQGADTVYRTAIENINEGAITLSPEGTILYSNHYFAKMMRADLNEIIGTSIYDFIGTANRDPFTTLLAQDSGRVEISLRAVDGTQVPVYVAIRNLHLDNLTICAVVTDLTEQKRSEEMLATKNLIQFILEQSPNAVIVCDAVGTVLYITQAAQRLASRPTLGHSIDPVLSNIRFSDKPLKFADVQHGSFESGTIVLCQSNSETLTFLLRHARIAQDGEVRGYVISLADITQLKKAEEALKESEERFRVLSEASPIGVGVSSADGVLLYANPSYALILGYNQAELTGKKASELYWNPEDRRSWVSDMKNNGIVRNIETRLKRKDGNPIWVFINASPIFYGGKQAVMGTIQDITERKKVEEALRQARDYLDNLFNYANAPIIVWNPEFEITRFNHAFERLTGRTAAEAIGKKLDILFPDDSREASMELIRKTSNGERWEVVEIPILNRNGAVHIMLWNSATLYAPDDKTPVAIIAQGQDITERKQTEQMKDEFIGLVSHELKTPITIVMGSIYTALTEGVPQEEARDLLQSAALSAESLASIVDNLLELSRVQANRLMIRKEQVDVAEIARDIITKLKGKSGIHRLILDAPAELPRIPADHVRVERIINNLVDNAIKYSPSGGDITISVHQKDDFIEVKVKDQGIGISAEDQARLFKPFERLGETNGIVGIGLGLNVCRRLVEAQNGRIGVESEPGKGSTFFFTLPSA